MYRRRLRLPPAFPLGLLLAALLGIDPATAAVAPDEPNAAVWYAEAAALFRAPSPDAMTQIHSIISNGWQGEHQALEQVLQENQRALELFRQAAGLTKIDFPNAPSASVPPNWTREQLTLHRAVQSLAFLTLLQGRRDEREGRPGEALSRYLVVLTAGFQLSQTTKPSVAWLSGVGRDMLPSTSAACIGLLEHPGLSDQDLRRGLEGFNAFEAKWKAYSKEIFVDQARFWFMSSARDTGTPFYVAMRRLADEYIGYAVESMETYTLETFLEHLKHLNEDLQTQAQSSPKAKEAFTFLSWALPQGPTDEALRPYRENYPELLAKLRLLFGLSSTDLFIKRYYEQLALLTLIKTGMAIQLYEAEHGAVPAGLDALVPSYLGAVPVDPLAKGAPLQYRQTPTGWWLWSVWTNGRDDGGKKQDTYGRGDMAIHAAFMPFPTESAAPTTRRDP